MSAFLAETASDIHNLTHNELATNTEIPIDTYSMQRSSSQKQDPKSLNNNDTPTMQPFLSTNPRNNINNNDNNQASDVLTLVDYSSQQSNNSNFSDSYSASESSVDFDNNTSTNNNTYNSDDEQAPHRKLSTIHSLGDLETVHDDDLLIDSEFIINKNNDNDDNKYDHSVDPRENEECKQLIFLYNAKSGGQKAIKLVEFFAAYTPLLYDLLQLNSSDNSLKKLAKDLIKYENRVVISIVGGDGSQSWACSLIDKALHLSNKSIQYPTIIPFPVGTGNDLSRSLGWSNTERSPDKIIKHVADIFYTYNVSKRFSVLDRWCINYNFNHIPNNNDDYINNTFSPPLPKKFLCYLSFGYDAQITYNFAMERKSNPKKFKSPLRNQVVYVRMGIKEMVKPSNPINEYIELHIDDKLTTIPKNTRSLKLVNINSAANGIFFWGNRKSRSDELQIWQKPQLNDGKIEVMATHGSGDLTMTKMKLTHAHRIAQTNNIKISVIKTPCYLQIDGEGWMIDKKCTLNIKLYDQLPTLIGYKQPRGVYYKYQSEFYNDKIKRSRHRFRDLISLKYNIPYRVSKGHATRQNAPPMYKKETSKDDFNLNLNDDKKDNFLNNRQRSGSLNSLVSNSKNKVFVKHLTVHDEEKNNNDDHKDDGDKKKKEKKNKWKTKGIGWKRNKRNINNKQNKTKTKSKSKTKTKSNSRRRTWF